MSPDISIVIVNWNTREMLRDCLRSIVDQTERPHEIIVVDNASSDGSAEMVSREFPTVILIANDNNRGFAAANNQGMRISRGRYVLLLNPDTIVLDRAIDVMVSWSDEHPEVGCAGCQVLEAEDRIQRTCFADIGPLNLLLIELGLYRAPFAQRVFGRPEYAWWDRRSERDVDVVSGMFMLVPKRVVEEVGLLDEAFFVYAEEADWCRRIRRAGHRCTFTPVARILHRDGGGKSTAQIRPRMYVQLQRSKLVYARKHHGRLGHVTTKTILLSSMLMRWLVFGTLARIKGGTETSARARLARHAALFHLRGVEPAS